MYVRVQERTNRMSLAERKTIDAHELWKSRGFEDLTEGAMQWKKLLRELKGGLGIWERKGKGTTVAPDDATSERWKLDLTEGPERIRRKLLRNYEFFDVYNVDVDNDNSAENQKQNQNQDKQTEVEADADTAAIVFGVKKMAMAAGRRKSTLSTGEIDSKTLAAIRNNKGNEGNDGNVGGDEFDLESELSGDDDDEEEEAAEEGKSKSELPPTPTTKFTRTATDDSTMTITDSEVESEAGVETETETEKTTTTDDDELDMEEVEEEDKFKEEGNASASSYELLTGLMQHGDTPFVKSGANNWKCCYNVSRCTGLEVSKALLLFCRRGIYIIDGFQQVEGDGLDGTIVRVKVETSKFNVNLRSSSNVEDMKGGNNKSQKNHDNHNHNQNHNNNSNQTQKTPPEAHGNNVSFQHRCQRIAFDDIFAVYKRRYQLRQTGLEFFDLHQTSALVSFESVLEREQLLVQLLKTPLPNSIFDSSKHLIASGTRIDYKKFMTNLRSKITLKWVNGHMSNFEYIMHLNTFAGRTYNDLTQYPVFPWVLSDYRSSEIDLTDESCYRDLSKPMGAIGAARAEQFKERYEGGLL